MKRLSLISLLALLISLPGYSQFWIERGWHQANCPQCRSMSASLQLHPKQAREYEKIVHKYGQRIEKESRRDYKHWDKAARKIYDLRMDRDRKLLRLLSPYQFDRYVHLTRERPGRIHEYRGWYEHPSYASVRVYPDVRRYENSYWSHHWKSVPGPKYKPNKDKYKPNKDKDRDRDRNKNNGRYDNRPRNEKPGRR